MLVAHPTPSTHDTMAKPTWAPPTAAQAGSKSLDEPSDWLATDDGELAFFRTLIDRRPVGTAKHWAMIDITMALKRAAPPPHFERTRSRTDRL